MAGHLRIGTLNLCLGLQNKKDMLLSLLDLNSVDVCGLQETEIPMNFPENILNSGGFTIELESNNEKKRAGFYIRNNLSYIRRFDLERENTHLLIIDVKLDVTVRIINVYRSFRPQGLMSASDLFEAQLELIKGALAPTCFVIGDFNLDASMEYRNDYYSKKYLRSLTNFSIEFNFEQIVTFDTWSRTINGTRKSSILDHIYTNSSAMVSNVNFDTPTFGDHVLVMATLVMRKFKDSKMTFKRNWKNYTPSCAAEVVMRTLNVISNQFDNLNVQEQWNEIERVMIESADKLAPLVEQSLARVAKPCQPVGTIKRINYAFIN